MNKKVIVTFILGMLAGVIACGAGIILKGSYTSVARYEAGTAESRIISSELVDSQEEQGSGDQKTEDAPGDGRQQDSSASKTDAASEAVLEEMAVSIEDKQASQLNSEEISELTLEASQNIEEDEDVSLFSGSSVSYEEWDDEAVYNGGDMVVYQNKIYRAKWWTQGEVPGNADVWEDTLEEPDQSITNDNTSDPAVGDKAASKKTNKNKKDFKVVGYYPSWKPSQTGKIRYDVLTHVIYAFAIPTSDSGLRPLENADTAKKIIKKAHKNGVSVLLAVGGWSYNDTPLEQTFESATSTEKKYKKLANAIVSMCTKYGFDGVDMDWEHPRVDGSSGKQYEKFMVYLGKRLHKKNKLLTSAVLSGATADGNIYYDAQAHSNKVLKAVDWIHVMAYDGGDGERHSSYKFAVNSGKYWKNTRKLPAEKVVLGVPFYGRPSWASYEDILKADRDAWKKDVSNYNGMEVWYNGAATIKKKTRYAYNNLGGVMIWELTQDTEVKSKSLTTAIGKVIDQAK